MCAPIGAQQNADCPVDGDCIDVGQWQLSLAIGVGGRTNPLQDGDPIPLVLLPDVAWYGEHFYWDNDEVGYQWQLGDSSAFEVFLTPNKERAFFSFWQPANIFAQPNIGISSTDPGLESNEGPTSLPGDLGTGAPGAGDTGPTHTLPGSGDRFSSSISIEQLSSREWSGDIGVRWHHFINASSGAGELRLAATRDITGVHQGSQVMLSYQHQWQHQDWQWGAGLEAVYKSDRLINYYYGLNQTDNLGQLFVAEGGWQPGIAVNVSKRISEQWSWLMFAKYQHLHQGMSDSPLVRRSRVLTGFVGAVYRF